MDKGSNTILLFTEQRAAFEYLSDEDAGRMIKAIYAYADEGTIPDFEGAMMSLFSLVRSQIDRSREAYQNKCEQNRRNSRKRKNMLGKSDEPSSDNENSPSLSTDNERCQQTTNVILPNPNRNPNPKPDIDDGANTHIINGEVVVEGEVYLFDEVWNMYGKFVGDVEALRKRGRRCLPMKRERFSNMYQSIYEYDQIGNTGRTSRISFRVAHRYRCP